MTKTDIDTPIVPLPTGLTVQEAGDAFAEASLRFAKWARLRELPLWYQPDAIGKCGGLHVTTKTGVMCYGRVCG